MDHRLDAQTNAAKMPREATDLELILSESRENVERMHSLRGVLERVHERLLGPTNDVQGQTDGPAPVILGTIGHLRDCNREASRALGELSEIVTRLDSAI